MTYVAVLLALALATTAGTALFIGLTHCFRLSRLLEASTELLNAAQTEMEHLRSVPFERLESYAVQRPEIVGHVVVEAVSARRKRVLVRLHHVQRGSQPLDLVSYVHQQGASF